MDVIELALQEAHERLIALGVEPGAEPLQGVGLDAQPDQRADRGTRRRHRPVSHRSRDTDFAIWRRIKVLPFDATFYDRAEDVPVGAPVRLKDPHLAEALRREAPGILAWAVRGCLAWQQEGLPTPDRVRQATEQYREEMDVLAVFLQERCLIGGNQSAWAAQLYQAYGEWCELSGEKPDTQRRFGLRLKERGFVNRDSTGGRSRWRGLGLKDDRQETTTPRPE